MRSRGRMAFAVLLLAVLQLNAAAYGQQQPAGTTTAAADEAPVHLTPEQVSALGTSFSAQLAEALADSSEQGVIATASVASTAGWFHSLKKELDQDQQAVDYNTLAEKKMREYYRASESHPGYDGADEEHYEQHPAYSHHREQQPYEHDEHAYEQEQEHDHAYKHEPAHHAYGEEHEHEPEHYPHNEDDEESYGSHHEAHTEEACVQETARSKCLAGLAEGDVPPPISYISTLGCCGQPYGSGYYDEHESHHHYAHHEDEEEDRHHGDYHRQHRAAEYEHEPEGDHHPYHSERLIEHYEQERPDYYDHHDRHYGAHPHSADASNSTEARAAIAQYEETFWPGATKPGCVWNLAYHAPVPVKEGMEQIGLATAACHFPKGLEKCGEELLCEGLSFSIHADIYQTLAISKTLPSSVLDESCSLLVPNNGRKKQQAAAPRKPAQARAPPANKPHNDEAKAAPEPPRKAIMQEPEQQLGLFMPGSGPGAAKPSQPRGPSDLWTPGSSNSNQHPPMGFRNRPAPVTAPTTPQEPAAAAPKPVMEEPKPAAPQKPEPATPVQQPKPAAQDAVPQQPKPKPAAQDAKPEPKPAATEQPKPAAAPVAEQPKPAAQDAKPEQPKPAATEQPKPAATEQPKSAAQPGKPAEQPKPAATGQPKPAAQPAKAEQPKPAAAPVTEQPKPAAQPGKPAEQPKPAATEQPKSAAQPAKPAEQPKPAAAPVTEQPKPAAQPAKPAEQPKPAATEQPKSAAQPAKPAEQPKPAAAEQPKPAAQPAKPAEQPKPAAAPVTEQPKAAAQPAKAAEQPKPTAAAATEQPKAASATPAAPTKAGRKLIEGAAPLDADVSTAQFFTSQQAARKELDAAASGSTEATTGHLESRSDEEAELEMVANPQNIGIGVFEDIKPTGLYAGKATIIAGRIKGIQGLKHHGPEYSHGVVEHILSFDGQPLSHAGLDQLPHDTPFVKPGAYKIVFFEDDEYSRHY